MVVIGGGTGSSVLLSGLKQYPVELTAIVPVTDDGGSTGRLRDEFGFLPVGDIRQCLAALAPENSRLKQLLLYRFDKGDGLAGHTLGNLILTAMEDMVGDEPGAVMETAKIFRLQGKVLPVTKALVKLVAHYSSGKIIESEHAIEAYRLAKDERIVKLITQPAATVNPDARAALLNADAIVLAPGDLFNSIISSLIIEGMSEALRQTKAKLFYVLNLMTLNSQTNYMTAADHVKTMESYTGRPVEAIIVNRQRVPEKILAAYVKELEFPVEDNLRNDPRVFREDLLADDQYVKPKSDQLKRSWLRHDPDKLAATIIKLLK